MSENNTKPSAAPLGMLPIHCDRKNKTVNVNLPVDDMKAYLESYEARRRNGAALLSSLEAIPAGQTPDLVVIFKGQAFVLPTIPDDAKQDVAIRRSLNAALGADTSGTTFFDVPAPTVRAAKTPSSSEA